MLFVEFTTRLAVSLFPVLLFLLTLVYLDSYKLVRLRGLLLTMGIGSLAAGLSLLVNNGVIDGMGVDSTVFRRYGAPLVEETLKASYIVWLIVRMRVGFMVDAAISGFAVGTGFAIVENTYYIGALDTDRILVWIIRGFGTAVMHGGMTAIFSIISKNLYDRRPNNYVTAFLPGLLLVTAAHSLYNHFVISPVTSTIILQVTLPLIILFVFYRSERSTRSWLGEQLDVDAELLEMISSGRITETRIGRYFQSVKDRFPPEMVFDMVCYLRLHTELAISAKGLLMMRESGFNASPPPDTESKLRELEHLEKSIGKTGRLAIVPFLHTSGRDLWQLRLLKKQ